MYICIYTRVQYTAHSPSFKSPHLVTSKVMLRLLVFTNSPNAKFTLNECPAS